MTTDTPIPIVPITETTSRRRRLITSRCRPVRVLAVNEALAQQHQPPLGKAHPVHVGQVFPSAATASEHLGYDFNAVAVRLAEKKEFLRRTGETGLVQITLRGVSLGYDEKEAQ